MNPCVGIQPGPFSFLWQLTHNNEVTPPNPGKHRSWFCNDVTSGSFLCCSYAVDDPTSELGSTSDSDSMAATDSDKDVTLFKFFMYCTIFNLL